MRQWIDQLAADARRSATIIAVLALGWALTSPGVVAHEGPHDGAGRPRMRGLADGFGPGQLDWLWQSPNVYRTASGAPGAQYWQQRVDYEIDVTLDEAGRRIVGRERISYTNNSPDALDYLWLQLEQNRFDDQARGELATAAPAVERDDDQGLSFGELRRLYYLRDFDGGFELGDVLDADGQPLPVRLVETMARIDLPEPLAPGASVDFSVAWSYPINDGVALSMRTGYECFDGPDADEEPGDGSCIFELAHWFPRLAAYTDYTGWQHEQFLGRGEFTLEFGDYLVRITAPADHQVAATGVLQNPEEVLTATQRERLERARTAAAPVFVVTPDEARAAQKQVASGTRTWVFQAENVRDFAFASSRKFIWDAWGHAQPEAGDGAEPLVLAMSFYPPEAEVLWSRYSTQAVVHTLEVYGRYAFPYPYPVAISVNGPIGGMEYPMICFNGPRELEDGTYWGATKGAGRRHSKFALISVVIHEVGHNFFPMVVNSDERHWTWLDEGINSFLQSLAELEWEEKYPSRRGEPSSIVEYMLSKEQVPVMSHSDALLQFGNNAYAKPATALSVLRHTIMGPELFDEAFREYSRRWRFKRPTPYDFFRTMEDASGTDLEWFWRGWFYSTGHVDIALAGLELYRIDSRDPEREKARQREERDALLPTHRQQLAAELPKRVDRYPALRDFYNDYDELDVTEKDRKEAAEYLEKLEPWERRLLETTDRFYVLELENRGGVAMPVPLEITYADGSSERLTLPAEIWTQHPDRVSKLLIREREITAVELDPKREIADTDLSNNRWPPKPVERTIRPYKDDKGTNPMQDAAGPAAE